MKLSTLSALLLLSPVLGHTQRRKRLNENSQPTDEYAFPPLIDEEDGFSPVARKTEAEERQFTGRTALPISSRMGCASGKRKIKFRIKLDKWGDETTWAIKQLSTGNIVMSNSRTYSGFDSETVVRCVDSGYPEEHYELTLYDKIGDGICCKSGEGSYTLSIEEDGSWVPLLRGGNFKKKEMTHLFSVRSKTTPMSSRDVEWLEAHNVRRQYWHAHYNTSYVPLKWSAALAESSRIYAEKLLDTCGDIGIIHDPDNYYGENMAKNRGGAEGWGRLYPADKITARFVDREVKLGYPNNYHMTQALWRPSMYVGCADTEKPWGRNGVCRMQVCRYSKTGNCDISRDSWEQKMMLDDSGCFPECPPEGCF